jgi:hypothetical protein
MGNELMLSYEYGIAERKDGRFIIFKKYNLPPSGMYNYLYNINHGKVTVGRKVHSYPFVLGWTNDIQQAWASPVGMDKESILKLAQDAIEQDKEEEANREKARMKKQMTLSAFKERFQAERKQATQDERTQVIMNILYRPDK